MLKINEVFILIFYTLKSTSFYISLPLHHFEYRQQNVCRSFAVFEEQVHSGLGRRGGGTQREK